MPRNYSHRCVTRLLVCLVIMVLICGAPGLGETISVLYRQGSQHGFLALCTENGKRIATGDVTQSVRGDTVTSRLTFRFRDGSIDQEVTVFSQRGVFQLISDHHIQHGPSFPKPSDVSIDARNGLVTSIDGSGKIRQEHIDLPTDLANGLPPNLLLNLQPSKAETDISFVIPTTKPRLIRVSVRPNGTVPFNIGGSRRKAVDYVLHLELGGLAGVIAPVIGKQPADVHIWILAGANPAFIREEGQLYEGGPIWTIEQISPTFVP